jgi:hypothetical protein
MDSENYVNISLKNNCFVIMPPKTGSIHVTNILKNFDFKLYKEKDSNFKLVFETLIHSHHTNLFTNHNNFKLLLTVRNPYSLMFSYLNFYPKEDSVSTIIDYFENSLQREFYQTNSIWNSYQSFQERAPDYVLRLENLYEDYSKIPFINSSEMFLSGELEKQCKIKKNEKPEIFKRNWKDYYNQTIADLVYYNFSNYFESFGYNKDSWKE